MSGATLWRGGAVFDGVRLHQRHAVLVEHGRIVAIGPEEALTGRGEPREAGGDILAPGFVDLQVNGGGGLMLNDAASPDDVAAIARAHLAIGTGHLLPTLISDTAAVTERVIDAVARAIAARTPGVAGLHLEGPHLAPARAGAHDPAHLRPMTRADRDRLVAARKRLPALLVTLAPEAASREDVAVLARAGITVALGHTEADHTTALAYFAARARAVTHLFNAMPPLLHRAPGLIGAALDSPGVAAGLIADGHHVHPAAMGAAIRAARGGMFLVSDAMAPAGTALDRFDLGGRDIHRRGGKLVLADGTLAGADLDLGRAVRVLVGDCGVPLETALTMATSVPARVAGLDDAAGRLCPGAASLIRYDPATGTAVPLLPELQTV